MAGELVRDCPLCDGDGCEECGHTGQKVRTHIDAGDGITMSVSGDRVLTGEGRAALAALARAAFDRMAS